MSQLWVQIVCQQTKTGVYGVEKGKASEFWNINQLIYNIKLKLSVYKSLKNPVLNSAVLYLAGGSDFTDKWFNKTHELFLLQHMRHSGYIGDLVTFDDLNVAKVDKTAYRHLIHAVWCSKSVEDPSKKSCELLRKETQKRKSIKLHLPDEMIIKEIGKRVSGTFACMIPYLADVAITDWQQYGFKYDEEKKIFIPNAIPQKLKDNA